MKKRTFGAKAFSFYKNLKLPKELPPKVSVMNPYKDADVRRHLKSFLERFFADNKNRALVFGINPGRFGAGITGITFTDPVALATFCGIPNGLPQTRERSSEFVYEFIELWGGPKKFYRDFFLTAVSPLGFIRNGINYNYYDDPALLTCVRPFIVDSIKAQLKLGARRDAAILLGTGKNQKAFSEINDKFGFFKKVYALEHPRFIMQYRRKQLRKYLQKYHKTFTQAVLTFS